VPTTLTSLRRHARSPGHVAAAAYRALSNQIELVDMSPPALRRGMAHGNIYKPDKVDAALSNYFRPGNLTALRAGPPLGGWPAAVPQ